MESSNIILEYIKVLKWPLILIIGFTLYNDKLFGIIENREIDAFGLKIGKQVDEVSSNYKAELEALKTTIKSSKDSSLLEKVEIIETNLERELAQVKQTALNKEAPSSTTARTTKVAKLERDGFIAVINRDANGAISAFSEASDLWPDYHNVSEINELLIKNKNNLSGNESTETWGNVTKTISDKYSWGMPSDVREQLIK
ncbi:MAG: hypothetical protein ABW168_24360 [Sedimenticola sp.]